MRTVNTRTVAFSVRLKGVARFRRCGVEFTTDNTPYRLERAGLADAQVAELLNTPTLDVEELGTAKASEKAPEKAPEGGK